MRSKSFQPGDRVVWWKQTPGGGYVFPVLATVLGVTPKRVKIDAEDEEGRVVRHVLPDSLQHHDPPAGPTMGKTPPKKPLKGQTRKTAKKPTKGPSKKTVKQPARGRSKGSGGLVVWSRRPSTP